MKLKRIAAGTLAASAFLIGTAGVAHADQPDKFIAFGKASTNGSSLCAVIFGTDVGHWSSDFNPSDVNAALKALVAANPDCAGKTSVIQSGQQLKP